MFNQVYKNKKVLITGTGFKGTGYLSGQTFRANLYGISEKYLLILHFMCLISKKF